MTVGELRRLLDEFSDDVEVVMEPYNPVGAPHLEPYSIQHVDGMLNEELGLKVYIWAVDYTKDPA